MTRSSKPFRLPILAQACFEAAKRSGLEGCGVAIKVERVGSLDADRLLQLPEGQFSDVKAIEVAPGALTKIISAFANSDGGELVIGVDEGPKPDKLRSWRGFKDQEAANGHLQIFEKLFPLGSDFQYSFIRGESHSGLLLHVQIRKAQPIVLASNGLPYLRRGAQSLPVEAGEPLRRLEYTKGLSSFETELTQMGAETLIESDVTVGFIEQVVPASEPARWMRKQGLDRQGRATVAGVLMFTDEPQALLPKRCGIKVYRYKTREPEGFRAALAFDPRTVEGCLYEQIKSAVALTAELTEQIPKMGAESLETISYPSETLHEIITNAVLHRDYSVADDVHIRIFDNRIEVQSPGRLPAHVTVQNILDERFARNGTIVRILNKFPDPPNKDVGEGLNTAFQAMHELGLKEPSVIERDNSVLVVIRHEALASPEEAIMDYLNNNETIKNAKAREITHIRADYQMKSIFGRMVDRGLIEQVPGTARFTTAYRKKSAPAEG